MATRLDDDGGIGVEALAFPHASQFDTSNFDIVNNNDDYGDVEDIELEGDYDSITTVEEDGLPPEDDDATVIAGNHAALSERTSRIMSSFRCYLAEMESVAEENQRLISEMDSLRSSLGMRKATRAPPSPRPDGRRGREISEIEIEEETSSDRYSRPPMHSRQIRKRLVGGMAGAVVVGALAVFWFYSAAAHSREQKNAADWDQGLASALQEEAEAEELAMQKAASRKYPAASAKAGSSSSQTQYASETPDQIKSDMEHIAMAKMISPQHTDRDQGSAGALQEEAGAEESAMQKAASRQHPAASAKAGSSSSQTQYASEPPDRIKSDMEHIAMAKMISARPIQSINEIDNPAMAMIQDLIAHPEDVVLISSAQGGVNNRDYASEKGVDADAFSAVEYHDRGDLGSIQHSTSEFGKSGKYGKNKWAKVGASKSGKGDSSHNAFPAKAKTKSVSANSEPSEGSKTAKGDPGSTQYSTSKFGKSSKYGKNKLAKVGSSKSGKGDSSYAKTKSVSANSQSSESSKTAKTSSAEADEGGPVASLRETPTKGIEDEEGDAGPRLEAAGVLYRAVVGRYDPKFYDRSRGWDGTTFTEAAYFCATAHPKDEHGRPGVPCPYAAYCPEGPDSIPFGGYRSGTSYAPVVEAAEHWLGWVQLGPVHSCVAYNYLKPEPSAEQTKSIMCCRDGGH